MTKTKCSCGNDKEAWMDCCKQCYAKKKSGMVVPNKDKEIRKMCCLKIASEQVKTSDPKEIVQYAKNLEQEYNQWG